MEAIEFDNFIYSNDTACKEDECAGLVKYITSNKEIFEKLVAYQDDEGRKKSDQDDFWFYVSIKNEFPRDYWMLLRKRIQIELYKYTVKYPIILDKWTLCSPYIKYHIVSQGEGYHVWHQENDPNSLGESSNVVLAWHLSLTTHENEGELEFLYCNKRIEPKAGRMIIFPAYFTHLHRGNPIRTENTFKHYVTGWWFATEKQMVKQ